MAENTVETSAFMGQFEANADLVRIFLEYLFMADNDKAGGVIIQII